MQITIVVDDKLVMIDRKPVHLPDLDWAVFDMDPANPDDDVAAVQFDTEAGVGHVEFKTRQTKQVNRPNNRPPDWHISAADFEKHFAFVLPAYEAKLKTVQAEETAREAEREAQMLASQKRRETEATAPVEAPAGYVTEEKAQALAKEAAEAAVARFAAELAKAGEGGGQL